jgi:adenylate cyclase
MSRLAKAVTLGLLTGLLGLLVSFLPFGLDLEEDVGLGLLFRLRGVRQPPPEVIIVGIDKASAAHLNLPEKAERWPRSLHARLVDILARRGAAVIAFDILFEEPRSPEEDSSFAAAMRNAQNVILCRGIKRETVPLPGGGREGKGIANIETLMPASPLFAGAALGAAPFPLPKVPVKVSQYWTFKTSAGDSPTLPVVAFQVFALEVYQQFVRLLEGSGSMEMGHLPHDGEAVREARDVDKLVRAIRDLFGQNPLGAEQVRRKVGRSAEAGGDERKSRMLGSLVHMYQSPNSCYLNFYGPPGTIPTVPYYQVLDPHPVTTGEHGSPDFRGKAVFVGLSDLARVDQKKDDFHTVFSQLSGLDLSGVEIAATAFANLLEDMPVQPLRLGEHALFVFLWGAVLGMACRLLPTILAAVAAAGLSGLYLVFAQQQFMNSGTWYPLVIPLFVQTPVAFLGALAWNYREEHRERGAIKKALGYYLPGRVAEEIARNVRDIGAHGQIMHGTCLCTDAEQYTSLPERMDPRELSDLLKRYYEVVFEPVRRRGGIVSDVIGDSMMAIWTTTHPDAALRYEACLAALDIANSLNRLNESDHDLLLPTRMGLHSGNMLLGNVGAMDHYEYRAVGDIVNTVTRIENLNKHLGTRILVSAEVLSGLDGFVTRDMGRFLLRGKSKPVAVHELLGRMEESGQELTRLSRFFAGGLEAYRRQSWGEAIARFRECVRLYQEDGPSLFYIQLCEKYEKNSPGEGWDGLVRLDKE